MLSDIELVVSELVTNAMLHGVGQIRLRLEVGDGRVSVGVLDGGAAPNRPAGPVADADTGQGAEGGRGLALVALLSSEWGIRPDDRGGKEVWADFPDGAPAATAPRPALAGL